MPGTPLHEGPPPIGAPGFPGGASPLTLDPLIVEVNGMYTPWLGARQVTVKRPVNGLPTATIRATNKRGLTVNVGSEQSPDHRRLQLMPGVLDEDLITIRTARGGDADYTVFEGYATQSEYAAGSGFSVDLHCTYIADDLEQDLARCCAGQLRRIPNLTGTQWKVTPMYALPCIFNPDGAKNYGGFDLVGGGAGPQVPRPYFADPGDAAAQSWSWARVLLYWYTWALRTEEQEGGKWVDVDALDPATWQVGPTGNTRRVLLLDSVGPGSLADQTLIEFIVSNSLHTINPDSLSSADADPWRAALLAKPRSAALEGLKLLSALDAICMRAGIGYVWETSLPVDEGPVEHGLRFFTGGDGANVQAPKSFKMPSPNFVTSNIGWDVVRQRADVEKAQVSADYRAAVNRMDSLGGAIKYECTIELVPGWAANGDWDVDPNNAAAVSAAVAALSGAAWMGKYNTDGASFQANQTVGRLWGLNTVGQWSAYGRATGHFAAAFYGRALADGKRYHDFYGTDGGHSNCFWGELTGAYQHSLRRRPFESLVTQSYPGVPRPPLIEVSYDSGSTWRGVPAGVEVTQRDSRIYFQANNLAADVSDPATGRSFAECYIRGTLRVRITAGIRGDEIAYIAPRYSSGSLVRRAQSGRLQRRQDFKIEIREDVAYVNDAGENVMFFGGNSQFKGSGLPHGARWDRDTEKVYLGGALKRGDRVRQRGFVQVPELIFPHASDMAYQTVRPGDRLLDLKAETDNNTNPGDIYTLGLAANNAGDCCIVGAIEWQWAPGGGDDGSGAYTTVYTLEQIEVLKT